MGMPKNIDLDVIQDYLAGTLDGAQREQIELAMKTWPGIRDQIRSLAEFQHLFQRARIAIERSESHQKNLELIYSIQGVSAPRANGPNLDDCAEDLRAVESSLKDLIRKTRKDYGDRLRAIGARIRELRMGLSSANKRDLLPEMGRMRHLHDIRMRIEALLEQFDTQESQPARSMSARVANEYVSPRLEHVQEASEYLDIPSFLRHRQSGYEDFLQRWAFLEEKLSSMKIDLGKRPLHEWAAYLHESLQKNNEDRIQMSSRYGYPLATLWLAENEVQTSERNRLFAEAIGQLLDLLSESTK
jgi:hypothetical protein